MCIFMIDNLNSMVSYFNYLTGIFFMYNFELGLMLHFRSTGMHLVAVKEPCYPYLTRTHYKCSLAKSCIVGKACGCYCSYIQGKW